MINKLERGDLIKLEGNIYKFMTRQSFIRGNPVKFVCQDLFTKKNVIIDIWDMRHAAEFIQEGSPTYKSIMVLYGSKEG
jgi:hypothetical protein